VSQGFYKRRRGILDHLEAGTVSLLDTGIHDYLSLKMNAVKGPNCNIPPGIVFTSSRAIRALCPKGISERAIRRSLENLERRGWIKRWLQPGKHGNYAVLIVRSTVRDEAGNEYRVIGEETSDWRAPKLKLIEPSSGDRPSSRHELSTDKELRSKNKEKTLAAKPAAASDSRFQPTINAYYDCQKKAGIEPSCDESDFGGLRAWLKRNPNRAVESIAGSLRNASASTDHYPLRPGFRLREFLAHESKYQAGPLLKGGPKAVQAESAKGSTSQPATADRIHTFQPEEIPA
jgi:hypothetical protein